MNKKTGETLSQIIEQVKAKLNQAYFAFHGAYADRPTSISPIGRELKELRRQSASLRDFLNTVAAITSRQDLRDSIKSKSERLEESL